MKTTWGIYIIVAVLALAGCSDEIVDVPVPGGNPSGGDDGAVALTLRFPNSGGPNTYAIDGAAENKISRLDILSFTRGPGSFLTDTLKYHISVKTDTVIGGIDLDVSGITKKINVKLKNMVDSQRLVIVANVSAVNFTTHYKKTMQEIVDVLSFDGDTWRNNSVDPDTTSFPMFGQMTNFEKFHSTVALPVEEIEFQMIRAVAKIDVGVDLYGTGDPALGFGSVFKIQNVYVCNANRYGYIAPHKDFLVSPKNIQGIDSVQIDKVNLVPSESRVTSVNYTFPSQGNRLGNRIYIPESDTLRTGYTPAFLVIEASYYGDPYFYRIDFTDGNKYLPILRNHNYVFNITGVRTKGYTSLTDARNAPVSRFGSLVLGDADDIGLKEMISYNNEYYLAVDSKDQYADWMGKTVTVKVKTSFPGGWKASDPSGFSAFTNDQPGSGQNTALGSITFNIADNLTGQPKEYSFNIKAGMLTLPVKITQSPGSNSYMVRPGQIVKIPIASANVDGVIRTTGATQYVIYWQKPGAISTFTHSNGILTVTAGSATGNGVIAMENVSGDVLYSWHIWVTDYDPDVAANQQSNNGFVFMNRNLGIGSSPAYNTDTLYYQWGRKDPLVSVFSVTFPRDTINPSENYLERTILYPTMFYAVPLTSTTYDWIGAGQNNSLWTTVDGRKGPYDPCPFGWRVPVAKDDDSGSPWYGFSNNSRSGATYPLAGYLDAFSGIRYDYGIAGGVWSASARAQQASAFTFTGSSAQRGGAFRANAYPVRCVKDTR